ncbi:maleylpyruvate isomerase family mycothiol-dependent enzyme [Gordonia westfalica]|uniref:TIGR03083 family protein n=1 Tax=Gordonia westfalica TaxID=158898 RepID=A0A1H2JV72_9ACTN|nr:maleylpyruvate isomerase family mycothiol-dependent enzyme [Gordonia westfalica]SDU60098.1 TIGR03083 family protein [Gordonia westfalica]
MSDAGVTAAKALVNDTLSLLDRLTPADWAADSACHGWRVHDVVTHMGFFFNFIADPGLVFPDNPSGTSERLNDAAVRERADWTSEQAVEYYRAQSEAGLATLTALQGEELRDQPLDMLDLGTYRLHQLGDAVAFDHLVHLTSDLLKPFGPLDSAEVSVSAAIDPAIDWMIAGLPQMNGAALYPTLERPIGLHLTGATDRSFVLGRDTAGGIVTVTETADLPADVAASSAIDFLRWGTTRSAWRSAVTVAGDRQYIAGVLDAVDIV